MPIFFTLEKAIEPTNQRELINSLDEIGLKTIIYEEDVEISEENISIEDVELSKFQDTKKVV